VLACHLRLSALTASTGHSVSSGPRSLRSRGPCFTSAAPADRVKKLGFTRAVRISSAISLSAERFHKAVNSAPGRANALRIGICRPFGTPRLRSLRASRKGGKSRSEPFAWPRSAFTRLESLDRKAFPQKKFDAFEAELFNPIQSRAAEVSMACDYASNAGTLTRRYGRVEAVRPLNLKVTRQHITRLPGTQRSGQSTTIRMLLA